jgi:hypothetical protein
MFRCPVTSVTVTVNLVNRRIRRPLVQ